jgi:RNA-binding protein with serine-rich domain 1
MSERGRSRSPKSLTRSPQPSSSRKNGSGSTKPVESDDVEMKVEGGTSEAEDKGFKVVVVSGLTKNVHKGHLEEVFGEYGKITGLDLPLFKVCKSPFFAFSFAVS